VREVRVRIAGDEVAKWMRRGGFKHAGPMGEPLAEDVFMTSGQSFIHVDLGARDMPYLGPTEVEFAVYNDKDLLAWALAADVFQRLQQLGVPINGAEKYALEVQER
jgi:hypothetical protein